MSNSVQVTYPGGGPDVTRRNKRSIIYIITGDPPAIPADNDPNGSVRLVVSPGDTNPHFEFKNQFGAYNDTGLRVSTDSLQIGLDLTVSAAASFIETFNPSVADEHERALVPHITFDLGGTASSPHTPVLKPISQSIIFGDAVSQITSTTIGINFTTTHARVIQTLFHEVGTLGASAEVKHSIFVGTDNTGILVNERNLGSSQVIANTALDLQFNFDMGLRNSQDYFIELTSANAFSLKTDSGGNPLLRFDEEELGTLNMVTENLVWNNDLGHVLDSSLNPVYLNQFPHSDLITA